MLPIQRSKRLRFPLRENELPRSRRTRRSSAAERQKRARAAISDTDLEALNDTKSPIAASLAAKKPYFLELDSYREALADDPNANAVDRHNSKERHRRLDWTFVFIRQVSTLKGFFTNITIAYVLVAH